jgi:hypothetical protein
VGGSFRPIGYIYIRPDGTEINIDRSGGVSHVKDLPTVPTAGDNRMYLLFTVTENATIAGLQCGDVTVGVCTIVVPPQP